MSSGDQDSNAEHSGTTSFTVLNGAVASERRTKMKRRNKQRLTPKEVLELQQRERIKKKVKHKHVIPKHTYGKRHKIVNMLLTPSASGVNWVESWHLRNLKVSEETLALARKERFAKMYPGKSTEALRDQTKRPDFKLSPEAQWIKTNGWSGKQ
jgi:hypothetical protein